MPTFYRRSFKTLLLTSLSASLTACGGGNDEDTMSPSISFTPSVLTVVSGQSATSTLTATDNVAITTGPNVICTNGGTYSGNTFTAPTVAADTISICTATASDAAGNAASGQLSVTITPPPNPAPTANIQAEKTAIDERQPFTLSGSSSSDPEGEALTYSWSQTAGATVEILSPTAAVLDLVMPETTADDTLQFTLEVSDGENTDTATINITLQDIVLSPLNTDFQKQTISGLESLSNPTSMASHRVSRTFDSFCDATSEYLNEIDIIGDDGIATRLVTGWDLLSGPSIVDKLNLPPITQLLSQPSLTSKARQINFQHIFNRPCADPFSNGGSTTRDYLSVHFGIFEDEGLLINLKNDETVLSEANICGAAGNSNSLFIATRDGTLKYYPYTVNNPNSGANAEYVLGPPLTLASDGPYCDISVPLLGDLIAVNGATHEIVRFDNTGSSQAPNYQEVERFAFDATGSDALDIIAVGFAQPITFSEGVRSLFAGIVLSDGEHDGEHRLITIANKYSGGAVNYRGFTRKDNITLGKGVPKDIFFDRNGVVIISDTVPYAAHFTCNLLSGGNICPPNGVTYIETGFDAEDAVMTDDAISGKILLVSKPLDDEVLGFLKD